MPRFKFQWSNISVQVLRTLAESADIDGDPAEGLRRRYGARPDEEFVRELWPVLLDGWLAQNTDFRRELVGALVEQGLGDTSLPTRNRDQQMDYLRSCRNAKTLRLVVLEFFRAFGEIGLDQEETEEPSNPSPKASSRQPRGPALDRSPAPSTGPTTSVAEQPTPARSLAPSAPGGVSQQELESRLWAAASSLRGPVDPSDFKAYIFPLLFFKRLSDAWDEEHAQAVSDFGNGVTDEVEADYHRFQVPKGSHWSDIRKVTENVGIAIQRALDRIQEANPDTLAGIFGDVPWGNKDKLPEPSLLNLIEAFNTLPLGPSRVGHDVLGNAYEYLLKMFADASGMKAGEFFTPRFVVRLLTRILEPQPTDTIYDPACGSGGMLIEAANEVIESRASVAQMRFYGQEVNLTTAAIARMNLFLHDIEDAKVLRGDTLRDPKFKDDRGRLQRYDIVIANPPFSLKNWGAEQWVNDPYGRSFCGTPPTGNADFAWVQHMVCSMKQGTGRVGVVMPHGVLFRGGAEARIRQCLIEDDHLDAVIGLPPNLFYSTSIPACLLILRAIKPEDRRQKLVFVDGSKRFTKGRNQNQMSNDDVEAIVAAYRNVADPDGDGGVQVRVVDHAEIKENGWDLNIGRYLKTATADTLDVATALANLAEAQQALRDAEARLAERLAEAGYG